MEIISQKSLDAFEIKKSLDEMKKRDKELNFRAKKVDEYIGIITKSRKPSEIRKELEELGITRLGEHNITTIMNIMPTDIDSLKTTLSGENLTLKEEDLKKILDTVKKHA
ncbi:hypothetical protein HOA59_03570 [archaeon]|jgi:DNA-directed RNA polymerase subunit F|nr:hypothetical protein [archaeon]MBT6824476.1 hypothetical protein [archaeon]MBT7106861.1 hypothetical protein [archaeon]MBT7297789.1 hypothetical protein [archaeon]